MSGNTVWLKTKIFFKIEFLDKNETFRIVCTDNYLIRDLIHGKCELPYHPQCLKITKNVSVEFFNNGIFVEIKLSYLVTLFDHKLQIFKTRQNWLFLAFLKLTCLVTLFDRKLWGFKNRQIWLFLAFLMNFR